MKTILGAFVAAIVLLGTGAAQAGQMDWTMRLTVDQVTASVVDADARRKVGTITASGAAEVAGETAQVTVLVLYDYANGTGPWQVYMTVAFDDGSVLTTYGNGLTVADAEGLNSHFSGNQMVVGGTGRFAGAHGVGTMAGQRAVQIGDAVQIDYTISMRLDE